MIQYYTLEEAAQLLQTTTDKLKDMVKRNEVRAFQDRGTLRFRKQEIDELVRSLGLGSEPELQLGNAPKSSGSPSSARRRSKAIPDEGTFNLVEDEQVPLADEPRSKSGSGSGRNKTGVPKTPSPRSPAPKAASDSDVRLVSDGSDLDFHLEMDDTDEKPKVPEPPKSGSRKKSKVSPPATSDSKIPLLPPDLSDDSDVKIEGEHGESAAPIGQQGAKSPSDSDIRLEGDPLVGLSGGKRREDIITEEIDLDAEAANIEELRRKAKTNLSHSPKPPSSPLPTTSPFELSENDLDMGLEPDEAKVPAIDGSSDFELTASNGELPIDTGTDELPMLEEGSSDELEPVEESGSDELEPLEEAGQDQDADEEVSLGELTGSGPGASGINIQDPADSGISLEGSEDEIEFDLSLESAGEEAAAAGPATPKGGSSDVSSEFELSLPEDGAGSQTPDSDSEFELTLDEEGSSELELEAADEESGSDSEFELTLDEEGGLTAADEQETAAEEGEEGKDIFETDFDVPALDEESESEAAPAEDGSTELEESEFELDLGEDEAPADEEATDEESASEDFSLETDEAEEPAAEEDEPVVDDEEDEPAPKHKKKKSKASAADEEDEDGLDISLDTDDEEEAEDEEVAVGAAAAAPAAEWGPLPALMLLPAMVILLVVGIMGFEFIMGVSGYHKNSKFTGMVIDPIARLFDDKLPKE